MHLSVPVGFVLLLTLAAVTFLYFYYRKRRRKANLAPKQGLGGDGRLDRTPISKAGPQATQTSWCAILDQPSDSNFAGVGSPEIKNAEGGSYRSILQSSERKEVTLFQREKRLATEAAPSSEVEEARGTSEGEPGVRDSAPLPPFEKNKRALECAGATRKQERRSPAKRGGRPRVPTKSPEKLEAQKTESRRPKPEIICWKKERQWIPAAEIPEELLENSGLAVLQDKSPLTQEESKETCWRLKRVFGELVIQWKESDGLQETRVALGQDGYLLFKLSGQDQNQGRRVKFPSSGSYLVMVPDNWERDDSLSGPAPVAPQSTSLFGYQAHFFELEKGGDGKIAFRTPKGDPFVIESKTPQFELVGNRLCDATEKIGPLFGERPPQIHATNKLAWKNVGTIVVGEEGSGRGRWRKAFRPNPGEIRQDLPSEVAGRKGGWYFLRLYDMNDELIESLDFRFISALKEIRLVQPSPLPSEDGHRPVCVEFLHEPGCSVQPEDCPTNIQIERQGDKTTLIIPPDPTCDKTRWLVGPDGESRVQVTILVERLWWAVGEEDSTPSKWEDRPLTLQRDDFAATSKRALWLRLPRHRWVNEIRVGFEESKARSYPVKVADKTVVIPLRDFGDFPQVRGIGITSLRLWICPEGMTACEGTLCELKIKLRCKFCDFNTFNAEDMVSHVGSFHLRDFFSYLTYEELRDRIPSLPYKIYQCSYCNYYVESGDLSNLTSTICNHIEKDCPKVSRGMGPITIKFRIVSDPDEIRENLIRNLPHICKCNLCGYILKNPSEGVKMEHLVKTHGNKLYELG